MTSISSVVDLLHEIKRLMELHGENPFKVRAFDKAIQTISQVAGPEELAERARAGKFTELSGIGKSISEILTEFVLQGKSTVRDELVRTLPPGLLEMTQISGLGPKKAVELIQKLGIQSLAELEYACRENRLLKIKGFGPKLQQKILEGILFFNSNRGLQKLSDV